MPDHSPAATPAQRLHDRYRDGAPGTPGGAGVWNPVIDLLLQHRSVRAYLPDSLAPGTLEALVAAGQSAATSSNLQVWSVVAVEDQGRRDRLAKLAHNQRHISQAPLFLVWLADLSRAARLGEQAGRDMEALPYMEAFVVAAIDAALAAQNAVTAAESMGLGTVYIGGMRNHPEEVAAELNLPPGVFAVFGMCVGYPDPAAPASVKPRLPQSVVLHREQYDPVLEPARIAAYDESLRGFQAEQGMNRQGWSELVRTRLGTVSALTGRDVLRSVLTRMGFGLR